MTIERRVIVKVDLQGGGNLGQTLQQRQEEARKLTQQLQQGQAVKVAGQQPVAPRVAQGQQTPSTRTAKEAEKATRDAEKAAKDRESAEKEAAQKSQERWQKAAEGLEKFNGVVAQIAAAGTGALLGFTAAASPRAIEQLTQSGRLLAGELGMGLIPRVVQLSGYLQTGARAVRGMNEGVKSMAGDILFWGTATAAATFTAGTFIRSLLAIREAYVAIKVAASGAAVAQQGAAAAGGGAAVASGGAAVAGTGAGAVAGTRAVAGGAGVVGTAGFAGTGVGIGGMSVLALPAAAGTYSQVSASQGLIRSTVQAFAERFGTAEGATMTPREHAGQLARAASRAGMFATAPASLALNDTIRWVTDSMGWTRPEGSGRNRDRQADLTAYQSQIFDNSLAFREQLMTQIYAQPPELAEQAARGEAAFADAMSGVRTELQNIHNTLREGVAQVTPAAG